MKLNKILTLFAALSLMVAPSCSDDDAPLTPLTEVNGENTQVKHNSLTFKWDKVAGATQYGYELYDSNDRLVTRDVTEKTTVTVGSLTPATDYTMKIWAYAALGSGQTSSEPIVLHATTDPLKAIAAPTVTYTKTGAKYTFSWKKVTNAEAYDYTLIDSSGEIVTAAATTSRSVSFNDLEEGDYTFKVKATTTKEGYETESETASVEFFAEDVFIWKATGTYTSSILGTSWEATLVYYGDDNYILKGWYGVAGYNLEFQEGTEDPDETFVITGDYEYDSGSYTYAVPTGRTELPTVWVYPWWNYSTFTGNQAGGAIKVNVWNNSAGAYTNDTFTWVGEVSGPTADEFVGTWTMTLSGETYINDAWDWEAFNTVTEVQFTKVDDYTIAMPALWFSDVTMNVRINPSDKTLTAQPMTVWSEYILAGSESVEDPVIGQIKDDGSIEFTDWAGWYDGYTCFYNQKAVFTKK